MKTTKKNPSFIYDYTVVLVVNLGSEPSNQKSHGIV